MEFVKKNRSLGALIMRELRERGDIDSTSNYTMTVGCWSPANEDEYNVTMNVWRYNDTNFCPFNYVITKEDYNKVNSRTHMSDIEIRYKVVENNLSPQVSRIGYIKVITIGEHVLKDI